MASFLSDLARGAESLLESVDRQAATLSEDLKDTPLKAARKEAKAAAERIESRERYVSRKDRASLLDESEGEEEAGVQDEGEDEDEDEDELDAGDEEVEINEDNEASDMHGMEDTQEDDKAVGEGEGEGEVKAEMRPGLVAGDNNLFYGDGLVEGNEGSEEVEDLPRESTGLSSTKVDSEEDMRGIKSKTKSNKKGGVQESKRVAMLERELDALDSQLVRMQEDLDAAQEVLIKSQEVAASREQRLKAELKEVETARELREKELVNALKEKQESISELEMVNAELRTKGYTFDSELAALEETNQKLKDELQEALKLAEKTAELRDTGTMGLQVEVQELHRTVERLRAENSTLLRDSEARASTLEETNSELSNELATLQRKLDTLELNALNSEKDSVDNDDELIEAQEAQRTAEGLLREERQSMILIKQDLELARAEVERLKSRCDSWEEKYQAEIKLRQEERAKLCQEIEALKESTMAEGTAALEQRISSLSKSVIAKQHEIEVLNSEKSALHERLKGVEAQARSLATNSNKDLEIGSPAYSTLSVGGGSNIRMRRRREGGPRSIARLAPIAKHKKLARAVDSLDHFFLTTGNLLKNEPWARLAFISYIMLLHLWVLYVLEFHTHEVASRSAGYTTVNDVVLPPGMSSSLQQQPDRN